MIINDITITSLETITAFDMDGTYRFTLDELQNAKIANTQDKTDITGKGGRKLNSLKKNKAVVVSGSNGLVSGGLLEIQTGSEFQAMDDAPVKWSDYLIIENNAATTSFKAVGTAGNEIGNVYIKNEDGTLGTKLTQSDTVSKTTFTYNPATKTIAFNEGDYEKGTEIAVFYMREITANVLENVSDTYSEKCQLYIDAFGEDKCGKKTYRVQFYIPKADFSGNFDFELGENQSVHAFEAESLAGSCGTAGTLWTYTVFGADEEDEEVKPATPAPDKSTDGSTADANVQG